MKLNPHFLHPFFLRLSPPLHSQLLPSPQQHKGLGLWSVPNSLSALVFVLCFPLLQYWLSMARSFLQDSATCSTAVSPWAAGEYLLRAPPSLSPPLP